jgi:hypothetical protein
MAGNKFLYNNAGQLTEQRGLQVTAGASSAGSIVALNASGLIDSTMLTSVSALPTVSAVASSAITAGMLVNIYGNAGVLNLRPADCTVVGSEANAFATANIASSATGSVNVGEGVVTGSALSGLTVGSKYFLGTAGAISLTAPATAGNVLQQVGVALSATSLDFQINNTVIIAA